MSLKFDKEKFNWYGLNHKKVRKNYGDLDGNLEYVGTFCVLGMYQPSAVYFAPNPDTSKGHKNYILFRKDPILHTYVVTGMSPKEIEPFRFQRGVYCRKCEDTVYSIMRHNQTFCTCGAVGIDGGRDYHHGEGQGDAVKIDLLKGIVTEA